MHMRARRGRGIRVMLLYAFFLLIILPLLLCTIVMYYRVSQVIHGQTLSAATRIFDSSIALVGDRIEVMEHVMNIITHDELVYQLAGKEFSSGDISSQVAGINRLTTSFSFLRQVSDVDHIRLYVDDSYMYSQEGMNIFSLETVGGQRWFQELKASPDMTLWLAPQDYEDLPDSEQGYYSLVRKLSDPVHLGTFLAVLRIDISEKQLAAALSGDMATSHSVLSLMRSDESLYRIGSDRFDSQSLGTAELDGVEEGEWRKCHFDDGTVYMRKADLTPSPWTAVSLIPEEDLFAVSRHLRWEMILIMLCIACIAYLLALVATNSSMRRIALLSGSMKKVRDGDLNVEVKVNEQDDEIGLLIDSFNKMVQQLKVLLEERYEYGKRLKSYELKALQAQINPHFLYNSLDLINCMAIKQNAPEIVKMVNSLARFYRLSLSKGKDEIPVPLEIEHAALYVQIQNLRFNDCIEFKVEVDPSLFDCLIMKMILQPIIENAILHGIFEKEKKKGLIHLRASLDDMGGVVITVTDDGVGMDAGTLGRLFKPSGEKEGSYGLYNIQERLQLAYGKEYGMSCTSAPGEGCTIRIVIPFHEKGLTI